MDEKVMTICCICGCKIDLKEVYLPENTGEPICDKCKINHC